jgi:hypothetical protein
MADYGIKISKAGTDVKDTPTETTKKNFIILSTNSVHKVSEQDVVSSDTDVSHGLDFAPFWDAYIIKNSGTEAHPANGSWAVSCDDTYLYCDENWGSDSLFYIIYLDKP